MTIENSTSYSTEDDRNTAKVNLVTTTLNTLNTSLSTAGTSQFSTFVQAQKSSMAIIGPTNTNVTGPNNQANITSLIQPEVDIYIANSDFSSGGILSDVFDFVDDGNTESGEYCGTFGSFCTTYYCGSGVLGPKATTLGITVTGTVSGRQGQVSQHVPYTIGTPVLTQLEYTVVYGGAPSPPCGRSTVNYFISQFFEEAYTRVKNLVGDKPTPVYAPFTNILKQWEWKTAPYCSNTTTPDWNPVAVDDYPRYPVPLGWDTDASCVRLPILQDTWHCQDNKFLPATRFSSPQPAAVCTYNPHP